MENLVKSMEHHCIQKIPITKLTITLENLNEKIEDISKTLKEHIQEEKEAMSEYVRQRDENFKVHQETIEQWKEEMRNDFVKWEQIKFAGKLIAIIATTAGALYTYFEIIHKTL